MEDEAIIALYWQRSEEAIIQTDRKYGRYCRSIAFNILENDEDTDQFDVSFHKPLGQAVLELPPNLPARSRIELTFSLNTEGLLIVEGIEPNSGYRVKAEMHSSSILSREQIVEQTELIRSLKLI